MKITILGVELAKDWLASSRAMSRQINMFVWRTKITDKYVGYNSLSDLTPYVTPTMSVPATKPRIFSPQLGLREGMASPLEILKDSFVSFTNKIDKYV